MFLTIFRNNVNSSPQLCRYTYHHFCNRIRLPGSMLCSAGMTSPSSISLPHFTFSYLMFSFFLQYQNKQHDMSYYYGSKYTCRYFFNSVNRRAIHYQGLVRIKLQLALHKLMYSDGSPTEMDVLGSHSRLHL